MSTVRAWLVPAVSVLAARWTQFVAGHPRLSRLLAPFMVSRLATEPVRRPVGSVGDVANRCRPIHFPQRGRGGLSLERLPQPGTADFDHLAATARRRRDVRLQRAALESTWAGASIAALGATGVPLRWTGRPGELPADLGRDLSDAIAAEPSSGRRDRELRSIRIRRAALRVLREGRGADAVTVLLASKRPADVERAVEFVANQRGVVVQLLVGLHGPEWGEDAARRIERLGPPDTSVRHFDATQNLGELLIALTEQARYDLIAKWDDDDWYGPDHLADLALAYDYSGAEVVGKAAEFVYLEHADVTIRRFSFGAESYSSTLAGGALLTSRDWIERVGGWPPVARSVDRELLMATQATGGAVYRTHGFQYVLRRRASGAHTWSAPESQFLAAATVRRSGLDLAFADVAEPSS